MLAIFGASRAKWFIIRPNTLADVIAIRIKIDKTRSDCNELLTITETKFQSFSRKMKSKSANAFDIGRLPARVQPDPTAEVPSQYFVERER